MKLKELQIEINEAIEMKDVVTLAYLNYEHHDLIATELNNFDSAHLEELTKKMENFDVDSARLSYQEVKEHYSKSKKDALTILNELASKIGLG